MKLYTKLSYSEEYKYIGVFYNLNNLLEYLDELPSAPWSVMIESPDKLPLIDGIVEAGRNEFNETVYNIYFEVSHAA
jgi:hypothetical protein